ncbi:MAG: hypothetical protein AB7O96_13890 [Pseudobdellovibrionaceae bacterium]
MKTVAGLTGVPVSTYRDWEYEGTHSIHGHKSRNCRCRSNFDGGSLRQMRSSGFQSGFVTPEATARELASQTNP